jgi:hypothetical protein
VYDAVSIEERNRPAVAVVNEGFANDAKSAASSRGMPGLRSVPTPIPCEASVVKDIESGAEVVINDIILALTRPLTEEEKSPKPQEVKKPSRISFKGDLEEINIFSTAGDGRMDCL